MYLAPFGQIGYLWLPADCWSVAAATSERRPSPESRSTFEQNSRYGLLAMGNGQAAGTEIGLGAAGVGTVLTVAVTGSATGCNALRTREAGLAVFFFAALS
jgi:hypothetical protein